MSQIWLRTERNCTIGQVGALELAQLRCGVRVKREAMETQRWGV